MAVPRPARGGNDPRHRSANIAVPNCGEGRRRSSPDDRAAPQVGLGKGRAAIAAVDRAKARDERGVRLDRDERAVGFGPELRAEVVADTEQLAEEWIGLRVGGRR